MKTIFRNTNLWYPITSWLTGYWSQTRAQREHVRKSAMFFTRLILKIYMLPWAFMYFNIILRNLCMYLLELMKLYMFSWKKNVFFSLCSCFREFFFSHIFYVSMLMCFVWLYVFYLIFKKKFGFFFNILLKS